MTIISTTVGKNPLRKNGISTPNRQQKIQKCSTWVQSQKRQNDLCSFPRQTFNITIIQVCAPTSNAEEAEVEWFCDRPTRPFRTNTPKRSPFHYRGLECKSRKSRNTWSKRYLVLEYKMKQHKGYQSFAKKMHWS